MLDDLMDWCGQSQIASALFQLIAGAIGLSLYFCARLRLAVVVLCGLLMACAPIQQRAVEPREYVYHFPVAAVAPATAQKGGAITLLFDPQLACDDARSMRVAWFYVWGRMTPQCAGVESVSMLWGADDVSGQVNGTSRWLLLFNEPDLAVQSDIPIERAVQLQHEIERCYPDRLLVSPAQSQVNLNWLSKMREAYLSEFGEYPNWSAIAIHCYAATRDMLAGCKNYVSIAGQWAIDWGAAGVFVSEFAVIPGGEYTDAEAVEIESEWIDEMLADPMVLGFAHFVNRWDDSSIYCDSCEKIALLARSSRVSAFGAMYQLK